MTPTQKRPTHARKVPNCRPAAELPDVVENFCVETTAGTAKASTRIATAARENEKAMVQLAMLQRTL